MTESKLVATKKEVTKMDVGLEDARESSLRLTGEGDVAKQNRCACDDSS